MPKEKQTKGFEIDNGQYIIIDPEEVAATIPESTKTLEIEAFIPCSDVDDVYFDKPYYLTPDKMGGDAFVALRDGMKKSNVAAVARTVLFRRMRTVLIRPHGKGLIATTMNYDYFARRRSLSRRCRRSRSRARCSTSPSTSFRRRRANSTRPRSMIATKPPWRSW